MITKMTKYSFILLSEETGGFLEKLQELGVVDITRSKKPVDATSTAMLEKTQDIKRTISILEKIDYSKDANADRIQKAAQSAELPKDTIRGTSDLLGENERLKALAQSTEREIGRRKPWGEFDIKSLDRLRNDGYNVRFYVCAKKKFNQEWAETQPLEIINEDGNSVWFVTISPVSEPYHFPLEETQTPEGSWQDAERQLHEIEGQIIENQACLLRMKERIPELEDSYKKGITDLDLYLADASKELAAEDMVTVLQGFAPESENERLCAEFDNMGVAYLKEEACEEDNPPIKLHNNKFTRMFEVLTGMYGMPLYSEFDPTPILGPFFLLFFAMCMGDAGYGILLFIIGFLLKKMNGGMAKLGPLVSTLGVGTFFVGIVLGTFFGMSLVEAAWVPQWLKSCMISGKIMGYDAQMVLAVAIGVFHICLAMTIKAICYTKRFGFKNTLSTWGWLLLIVGGLSITGLAFLGVMSAEVTKWAVIVLGVISALGIYVFNDLKRNPLLNIGVGLWDTYNMVTGLLGDVLSYIRLYALGLAGGMLGNAFNNLGGMIFDGCSIPGLNWLFFIVILIIGHALNLAMSCLGAFVHPLRLTFVEYFKNSGYEGKGAAYNPLTIDKEE